MGLITVCTKLQKMFFCTLALHPIRLCEKQRPAKKIMFDEITVDQIEKRIQSSGVPDDGLQETGLPSQGVIHCSLNCNPCAEIVSTDSTAHNTRVQECQVAVEDTSTSQDAINGAR